jgi:hypothetical protein
MGPRYTVPGVKVLHENSEKHVDDGINVVVRGIIEELEVDDRAVDIVTDGCAWGSVRMILGSNAKNMEKAGPFPR